MRRERRRALERGVRALLALSTITVVLPILLIFGYLLRMGSAAFDPSFWTQSPEHQMKAGGIFPAIVGTLDLLGATVAFALPVGVLAAIYLSEYARPNLFTRAIRLAIVNLAGVPSVVYGLFGLGVFVLLFRFDPSVLSAGLTLGILILPVVITASEEALRAVPQGLRHASLALGSTQWQTVFKVVLPNAIPGILTGVILGLSRAAGETAPILFTGAAFFLPSLPRSLKDPFMALPYHLYIMATQVPNAPPRIQWGTAGVLLILVLSMNVAASAIRAYFRRQQRW